MSAPWKPSVPSWRSKGPAGMLTWSTAQEEAAEPVKAAAQARRFEAENPVPNGAGDGALPAPHSSESQCAHLTAQLVAVDLKLRVVRKDGGVQFYSMRRGNEAWNVTSLHAVAGIAARMQSIQPAEVA